MQPPPHNVFFRIGKWIKTTIIHQPSKSVTRVLPQVKVCPLFSSLMISKWNLKKIPVQLRRNEMPPLFSFFYIYGKHEYHRVRESNGFRRHTFDFLFIAGLQSTAYNDSRNICRLRQYTIWQLATNRTAPHIFGCVQTKSRCIILHSFFHGACTTVTVLSTAVKNMRLTSCAVFCAFVYAILIPVRSHILLL